MWLTAVAEWRDSSLTLVGWGLPASIQVGQAKLRWAVSQRPTFTLLFRGNPKPPLSVYCLWLEEKPLWREEKGSVEGRRSSTSDQLTLQCWEIIPGHGWLCYWPATKNQKELLYLLILWNIDLMQLHVIYMQQISTCMEVIKTWNDMSFVGCSYTCGEDWRHIVKTQDRSYFLLFLSGCDTQHFPCCLLTSEIPNGTRAQMTIGS